MQGEKSVALTQIGSPATTSLTAYGFLSAGSPLSLVAHIMITFTLSLTHSNLREQKHGRGSGQESCFGTDA